jgi:nucleotide-binding universal stress UspA family protein
MHLKSILVLVDFGDADAAALRRAGQLATTHRATLRLLHAPRADAPPHDASRRLLAVARQLQERTGARVKTVPAPARTLRHAAAEARWSDLVVLAARQERSIAAFFLGQPLQRLLRQCTCPLLLVRSDAAQPYERVLAAGDGAPASNLAIGLAAVLAPRAQVVLAATGPASRGGAARAIAGEQQTAADLVAVGTQRLPAWKDWLTPAAPRGLLRQGAGDLLLVPEGYVPPGHGAAARRLLRDQERCRSAAPALSRKRPS